MQIDFELKKRIGCVSKSKNGWTKELNLVVWEEKYVKYDIRTWDPAGKPGKCVTLTLEEAKELYRLLGQELEGLAREGK